MFKDVLLERLQYTRARTLAVAAAMPPDRFEFRPWEGSMSFGDQLRHIASVERTLVLALRDGTWLWGQGITRSRYPDKGSVRAILQETASELRNYLVALPEPDLLKAVQVPWDQRGWTVAGLVVEWVAHECHHVGQLYLHLRLCGIEPPRYE